MIAIVDYHAGNLKSISHALKAVGAEVTVTCDANSLENADKIVLPGVGSFARIKDLAPIRNVLTDAVRHKKPLFGICLGMQFLFSASEEAPGQGLSFFPDVVRRLHAPKIPHMGWNTITIEQEHPYLEGITSGDAFYFVHSFAPPVTSVTIATCEYGETFSAVVGNENVFGTQFHPEKSGEKGLRILRNFVRW